MNKKDISQFLCGQNQIICNKDNIINEYITGIIFRLKIYILDNSLIELNLSELICNDLELIFKTNIDLNKIIFPKHNIHNLYLTNFILDNFNINTKYLHLYNCIINSINLKCKIDHFISCSCKFNNIIFPDDIIGLKLKNSEFEINKLPKNLRVLNISNCKCNKLPDLPNYLREMYIVYTKIDYIPKLPNKIKLYYDGKINYLEYNPNMEFNNQSKFYIEVKNYGIIDNEKKYNLYMEELRNKKYKSARK